MSLHPSTVSGAYTSLSSRMPRGLGAELPGMGLRGASKYRADLQRAAGVEQARIREAEWVSGAHAPRRENTARQMCG